MVYRKELQIRWADLDINGHIRHSVYYDWGSFLRVAFLAAHGLTIARMLELHIGPIIFREEAVFKKEVRQDDKVFIELALLYARRDFSRWGIQHVITKAGDIVSTIITIDGAWMDTDKRKLCRPPEEVITAFSAMPLSESFKWTD